MRLFLEGWLDVLFPRMCPGCGSRTDTAFLCDDCRSTLSPVAALNLSATRPDGVDEPAALWRFEEGEPVQQVLHRLKYGNSPWLGIDIGAEMATMRAIQQAAIDLVVPVPLHPQRRLKRGYNQSEWIARGVARSIRRPTEPDALRRTRSTASQTKLDRDTRESNVEGAFEGREAWVGDCRVLLVDDTLTTGATLFACAASLLRSGAQSVLPVAAAAAPLLLAEPGTGIPVIA